MRLVVKPENITDAIALQTRKELQPFLLGMLGMGVSQTLITAVRLKVFDSLHESPKTTDQLAKALGGDTHGMQVLLESLDGFGFVRRRGNKYHLTRESTRLLSGADDTIKDFLRLGGHINRQMVLLEEDIRTGEVPNFHFQPQSPTCFSNYYTMLKSSGKKRSRLCTQVGKTQSKRQNDC